MDRSSKEKMKICTGYYDLHEVKAYPCSKQAELTHSNLDVCRDCNELMGFRYCVMCRGNTCKATNSDALAICEREHVLYLAYFPDNKVKVGTTLMERRYERVLEQKFRSLFFQAYPGIKEWHDSLKTQQPETGQTISGRKFPFLKQYGLPAYCNTPVQGTAADILKKALGILAAKLSGTDTYT